MPDPDWARVVVYPATMSGVTAALHAGMVADIVVKTSGVGVFDALLEAAVLAERRPGQVIIFWDVDAPVTLDRLSRDPGDPFLLLIPQYDLILTYGGGDPVVEGYQGHGARACVPVYHGLDPDVHHPVARDARFRAHLAFLGNRLPDREARVEQFFLEPAAALPQTRFLLGGNGWSDKAMSPNAWYAGHVYTRDHNAFNSTPLAVLNISRDSMARYGFSPATRVFEAAGAGACIITDAWEGIERFLHPGREVLVARGGEEVADHLRALTPIRAREIGRAAMQRVVAEHTYMHRVSELEALLALRVAP